MLIDPLVHKDTRWFAVIAFCVFVLQLLAIPIAPWPWWMQILGSGLGAILWFVAFGVLLLPRIAVAIGVLNILFTSGMMLAPLPWMFALHAKEECTMDALYLYASVSVLAMLLANAITSGIVGWVWHFKRKGQEKGSN